MFATISKCVFYLLMCCRSAERGVMVPPVCVDTNKDGVRDIFMVAYDGTVTLFDGETMRKIWSVQFTNCKTFR